MKVAERAASESKFFLTAKLNLAELFALIAFVKDWIILETVPFYKGVRLFKTSCAKL